MRGAASRIGRPDVELTRQLTGIGSGQHQSAVERVMAVATVLDG